MSAWNLRTRSGMPAGGITYIDPRTPSARWEDDHTFMDDRVRDVLKFRAANPRVYPEPEWNEFNYVREQVALFNCTRLNFDTTWCYQHATAMPQVVVPERLCTCGEPLTAHRCAGCGGKIEYYECLKCGKSYAI